MKIRKLLRYESWILLRFLGCKSKLFDVAGNGVSRKNVFEIYWPLVYIFHFTSLLHQKEEHYTLIYILIFIFCGEMKGLIFLCPMDHSILARTHLGLGACSIRQKCWLERVKILSINQSLKGDQHQTVVVLLLQAMFAATTKTTAVGGHMKARDFS